MRFRNNFTWFVINFRRPEKRTCAKLPRAGFTLVELMISVLVLGIGLTVVANSYILALRGVNAAGNNISALILAKAKYENLEFASLKGALPSSVSGENTKSLNKNYNYQLEISAITASGDLSKNLVSACLAVSWLERNLSKNVTLSTYLSKQK